MRGTEGWGSEGMEGMHTEIRGFSSTRPVWTFSQTSESSTKIIYSNRAPSADRNTFSRPEIDERLRSNTKITILPHVGTHTYESRYEMEMLVLEVSSQSSTRIALPADASL